MIDKNQAVINFLGQCDSLTADHRSIYFNFVDADDGDAQIITLSNDVSLNKKYIDGTVLKNYLFTLLIFKSLSQNAIVTEAGYPHENVEDMSAVQEIMDWVNEQNDLHNYPDFGEYCTIESMETTSENPTLEGVNTDVTPVIGMYSFTIRIEYLDQSKKIWG